MNRKIFPSLKALIAAVFVVACTASCSGNKVEDGDRIVSDPKSLFHDGSAYLSRNDYEKAIELFEKLENEHPASVFTPESRVRKAYAYYLTQNHTMAQLIIDDFVKEYPAHSSTPYMYYLKGLTYYNQIIDVGRDQDLTHKSIEAFRELQRRYPNSPYARDAQLKIDYAISSLAGKEMEVGRFYVRSNKLIAALGRFKNVVDQYQESIFITEALYRLAEIYLALGDRTQAQTYIAVLGHNYPEDPWYAKATVLLNDKR